MNYKSSTRSDPAALRYLALCEVEISDTGITCFASNVMSVG